MQFPSPKSAFLQEVVSGFRKRSKAIKYHGYSLACERLIERTDNDDTEKIEFECKLGKARIDPLVRLYIWEDRWVWVDASKWSKDGWVWEWRCEGRLIGNRSTREIISAFEDTLSYVWGKAEIQHNILNNIWGVFLAQGPKRIE